MKEKKFKIIILLLLGFVLLGGISGCAWWAKKEVQVTPQEMYNKAMLLFQKKKYEQAAEEFKKFKEEFPLSHYTPLAELRIADALFFSKTYAEAIVNYEEFKKLHPLHPEIPYAIYQVGLSHFKQMHTLDRDQTETEKAIEQFRYLIENFPQSPHTEDAKQKTQICQRQLAEHEFYIGHFYFRTKKYRAAFGRFEGILQKYPGFGLEGEIKPLIEKCLEEIAKEEQKRKEKEAQEEKKKGKRKEAGFSLWPSLMAS
ncbi:MAG: outer membrane protein assembly factor BamD [Thermodesulfobacteriota bacterium]|nr:outer membrane protein assembly factor BamD [Thermodesulfobacteriota bacterium]